MEGAAPVLIYDRTDQNRRNTFLLMFLFVLLVAGFATAIGIVVGVPPQYAAIVAVPVLLFALLSHYSSTRITLAISAGYVARSASMTPAETPIPSGCGAGGQRHRATGIAGLSENAPTGRGSEWSEGLTGQLRCPTLRQGPRRHRSSSASTRSPSYGWRRRRSAARDGQRRAQRWPERRMPGCSDEPSWR